MKRHLGWVGTIMLLVVVCMLLPFLPGGYDGLAVPLSVMAQLFALGGLLLVPLGGAWLLHERRLRATSGPPVRDLRRGFGLVTVGALTIVALLGSLGATATIGPSLGMGVMVLSGYGLQRLAGRLKTARAEDRSTRVVPLYLLAVPLAAVIARTALLGPASEFSRHRVIDSSERMIDDIERYRDANGHYPLSLLSLQNDYRPRVIGVPQYHYEPSGDAYNLYFEHLSDRLGTREIVMFNPRDGHEMTSHDSDLLRRSPSELSMRRGYYEVRAESRPHWKRFFFD